jgi:hypothetical protein
VLSCDKAFQRVVQIANFVNQPSGNSGDSYRGNEECDNRKYNPARGLPHDKQSNRNKDGKPLYEL